jgi:hypothetical protein
MSIKLEKLLHVLGNCLNNVNLIMGIKETSFMDNQSLFFHLHIHFSIRYAKDLE